MAKKETVAQQSQDAATQRDEQAVDVDELQTELAAGRISFDEYNAAVGQMFDERLTRLRNDLRAQGRGKEAQSVPVGIGTAEGPRQHRIEERAADVDPFSAPEGVDLSGGSEPAPEYDDEYDELMFETPTIRPQEKFLGATAKRLPPPDGAGVWLRYFLEAARDPNAPQEVHDFVTLLTQNWRQ